jgi:hypothetical protein
VSGADARRGFAFQDLVLLDRVLAYASALRRAEIEGRGNPIPTSFGVEAKGNPGNADDPEWDIVVISASGVDYEEVKSGAVDRDDRLALWSRVRNAHVAGGTDARVRLTVSKRSKLQPYWDGLADAAVDAMPRNVRRVGSAQELASEALLALTAGPDGLPLDRAREVLSRFYVDRVEHDELDRRVRDQVACLMGGLGASDVLRGLRGFVADRAEGPDRLRLFTAGEAIRSVECLAQLARVSPQAAALWRKLSAHSISSSRPPARAEGLPPVHFEQVTMPEVARTLRSCSAVVVVGRGGIGKSTLLEQLRFEIQESCVGLLISAADLGADRFDDLAEAMRLGAFVHRESGGLVICLDALENVSEARALLAAIRPVEGDYRVITTCRASEWLDVCGTQSGPDGWQVIELAEWPSQLVERIVEESHRPAIHAGLLQVVRTPIFLDLFLRTFGSASVVPPGLQSSHALLTEYWGLRILPDNDPRALATRELLDRISHAEMQGRSRHNVDASHRGACTALVSEGLLMVVGGQVTFRHALLRDFAVMRRIVDNECPRHVVSSLQSTTRSLVRFGAARAVVEDALQARPHDLPTMISTASDELLRVLAMVLAELEDPSSLDVEELAGVLQGRAQPFLEQLVHVAAQQGNVEWLGPLARAKAAIAFRVTAPLLEHMAMLARKAGAKAPAAVREALVEWATILRPERSQHASFARGKSFEALAGVDPSSRTLHWLSELAPEMDETERNSVLDALPTLVARARARGESVSSELVIEAYASAANMRRVGVFLVDGDEPSVMRRYRRIERVLLGHGIGLGLRVADPRAFVEIALALIGGEELKEAEARRARAESLAALVPDFAKAAEPDELERRAEELIREWGKSSNGGGHAQAEPQGARFAPRGDMATLVSCLRQQLRAEIEGGTFERETWPLVLAIPSIEAKTFVLAELVQPPSAPTVVLDALLDEPFLYSEPEARPWTQRAIAARWGHWSPSQRRSVLARIVDAGHDNPWAPGPLLSVVPSADLPSDLGVLIDLCRRDDVSLELRPSEFRRGPTRSDPTPVGRLGAADDSVEFLSRCPTRAFVSPSTEEWSDIVTAVRGVLHGGQELPDVRESAVLGHLVMFARRLDQHADLGAALSSEETQKLCTLAIDWASQARRRGTAEMYAWTRSIDLVDAVLSTSHLADHATLYRAFFGALDEHTRDSTRHAEEALITVGTWFGAGGAGIPLLMELLQHRVRNGDVLVRGVVLLPYLSAAEHAQVLRAWLDEHGREPIRPTPDFLSALGERLGYLAVKSGLPSGENLTAFAQEALSTRLPSGPLACDEHWRAVVSRAVFGAQNAVHNGHVQAQDWPRYVEFVMACWEALRHEVEGVAAWAFSPVLRGSDAERAQWWRLLRRPVLRVLQQGRPSDVFAIMSGLAEVETHQALPARDMLEVLRASSPRLVAMPDDHYISAAVSSAARMCVLLSECPQGKEHASEVFELVSRWGAPPLSNADAIRVARLLRSAHESVI